VIVHVKDGKQTGGRKDALSGRGFTGRTALARTILRAGRTDTSPRRQRGTQARSASEGTTQARSASEGNVPTLRARVRPGRAPYIHARPSWKLAKKCKAQGPKGLRGSPSALRGKQPVSQRPPSHPRG